MDKLMAQGETFDPKGRNLFQYYVPPRPARKAPPPQPAVRKPVTTASKPRPTRRVAEEEQRNRNRPPAISFKYLGFLGPKDARIGVFEKNEELELVRVGEVLQKDFRLVGFGYESVMIGYVDDRFKDQTTELKMSR
jgi:hypothetical protein